MYFISFFYQNNNTTFYFPFPQQKYISFFIPSCIENIYPTFHIQSFSFILIMFQQFRKKPQFFHKSILATAVCIFLKASFVLQFLCAMFWLTPGVFTFQRHDKICKFQRQKEFKFSPRSFGMYFFITRSLRKLLFKIFISIRGLTGWGTPSISLSVS